MVDGESSTVQCYVDLLKSSLTDASIDINWCISDLTDGVSNMKGINKGFSSLLKNELPTHVHTWCYVHVLNLVMADATGIVIQSTSLFSLLNDVANFIKESYKRKKWEQQSQTSKRPQAIGKTLWWAKSTALERVYGTFGHPEDSM